MLGKRKNNQKQQKKLPGDNIVKKNKNQAVQKKQKEQEYDDISSDNVSLQDEDIANGVEDDQFKHLKNIELDDETVDQKRLRLAQQILKSAKKESKIKDDFFQTEDKDFSDAGNDDDDKDSYVAVDKDDDFDDVTKTLQENLLKKKNLIYNMHAESIKEKYEKGQYKTITLKGHLKTITCMQICPTKKFLYSASKDTSIIKWDIEKQTKTFISLGKKKHKQGHYDEILCMSLNYDGKYLVTAGKDRMIKLWDVQQEKLIETFKGHKDTINGLKFGQNSNQFCSVSADRTFKQWDATERAFMDTLYGHKCDINAVDACSADNFISVGYDRQNIYWKTEHSSQLIFSGHERSIDCVKGITNDVFVTGSEDGTVALWGIKKKKPLAQAPKAHDGKWITALGNSFNTDVLCSGSHDKKINMYQIDLQKKQLNKMFEISCEGIINDIQFSYDCQMMAYTQGEEHRQGRWITENKIKNTINLIIF